MLWTLKKAAYRSIQSVMKLVAPMIPFPVPEILSGAGCVKKLPDHVKSAGVSKVMIVTDKGIVKAGLLKGLTEALDKTGIDYYTFDDVQPNPTIMSIEEGLKLYHANQCKGIIAMGGGSPMDCAKTIGARATNPRRSILKMKGLFKIWRKLPPFYAIPTTAGTGSETTIAAVITDSETHEKFAIMSLKVVPLIAVLDPELMVGLPPHITSTTGMDALTHAVEAYIGRYAGPFENEQAEKATRIIFDTLEDVYQDGSDLEKRNQMALASYYAGTAFTRAYVGYVHAIAHNMGGLYGVPHGLANAVILPYVLEYCKKEAQQKLVKLAIAGGIAKPGEPEEKVVERFIEKIKSMNRNMSIPTFISELKEKDIPLIAERALAEAHPDYPVPTFMDRKDCEALIRKLLPQ